MPPPTPDAFTHGDLASLNIMVRNGNITGIIDWDTRGCFPAWWEYTAAGVALSDKDNKEKTVVELSTQARLTFITFRSIRS